MNMKITILYLSLFLSFSVTAEMSGADVELLRAVHEKSELKIQETLKRGATWYGAWALSGEKEIAEAYGYLWIPIEHRSDLDAETKAKIAAYYAHPCLHPKLSRLNIECSVLYAVSAASLSGIVSMTAATFLGAPLLLAGFMGTMTGGILAPVVASRSLEIVEKDGVMTVGMAFAGAAATFIVLTVKAAQKIKKT